MSVVSCSASTSSWLRLAPPRLSLRLLKRTLLYVRTATQMSTTAGICIMVIMKCASYSHTPNTHAGVTKSRSKLMMLTYCATVSSSSCDQVVEKPWMVDSTCRYSSAMSMESNAPAVSALSVRKNITTQPVAPMDSSQLSMPPGQL